MQQFAGADAVYYDSIATGLPGDVEFYLSEIRRAGSPVLELGCGTGRMLVPIALEGIDVVGLDMAPAMLDIARAKVAALPDQVRDRVEIVHGDMRDISLNRRFKLVLIPYRAFLHLMTVEDQRAALTSIHEHLEDGGRLVFDVFDPNLDMIAAHSSHIGTVLTRLADFDIPESGRKAMVWETREYDLERQVLTEYRIFEELDDQGVVAKKTYTPLELRWIYRYEMVHLLELCGFEIEALYGDFNRGSFKPGGEQVWVARAAG
ncbi:MAG: class I SAM-dependent methyltransferase [SAR202 cluster bacterium]|jgi:SAM-dependent methyltransferase|nr:class I SAM-dependent methyltransferase [SAR202 cluster bacterium]MDP6664187.1 class I SAM-dependent methyltransferase [SAR202 cluster bacterium]MDP6799081.1 class I SAM-dependent methyltransferase [SAR202 cluster bacterium]|tara:strand:- start:5567 stop:6352 length:786 start_codon:yes stop_codon:yes gene_type:complete